MSGLDEWITEQELAGGLICLAGMIVTSFHFVPLLGEEGTPELVLMGAFPLSLSFVLLAIGLLTARGRLIAEGYSLAFAGWVLAGMVLFLATGGWVLLLTVQVSIFSLGPLVPYLASITATTSTLGGITGAVIGLYDTQNRKQTAVIEEKRNQLERQNRRLDEFASIVSHDLRNPLSVASLRIEYARNAEEVENHLDSAAQALDSAEALIADMLVLAGQGELIEETTPVSTQVAAKSAWQCVPTDGATLEVAGDRTVQADRDRLEQVFENLFANAVDHCETEVTVTVGRSRTGFYVADTGPGLPEEPTDELFEMGYSTDSDGTGYGLAIVDSIVDAHDWRISAQTTEDGARFEIDTVEES